MTECGLIIGHGHVCRAKRPCAAHGHFHPPRIEMAIASVVDARISTLEAEIAHLEAENARLKAEIAEMKEDAEQESMDRWGDAFDRGD